MSDSEIQPRPTDIITQDQIQDLWGIGFTVVSRYRGPDPFFVPPTMVPQGRSYQWWHLIHDRVHFHRPMQADGQGSSGWAPVPASRHDGYFMPFGHVGDIEVGGLGLFEKPKFEVDQERRAQIDAAKAQTDNWITKTGADFSGHVKVGDQKMVLGEVPMGLVNPDTKTIETTVAIPKNMVPYISLIFKERDALKAEVVNKDRSLKPGKVAERFYAEIEANPEAPWWPTLHAILLPLAIDRVRAQIENFPTETES